MTCMVFRTCLHMLNNNIKLEVVTVDLAFQPALPVESSLSPSQNTLQFLNVDGVASPAALGHQQALQAKARLRPC